MSKMKQLYEKVAADSNLQSKFSKIMGDSQQAGEEATKEKVIAFAKEAGYLVTMEEMKEFFTESKEGILSEAELDQVAGGKRNGDNMPLPASFIYYECMLKL